MAEDSHDSPDEDAAAEDGQDSWDEDAAAEELAIALLEQQEQGPLCEGGQPEQ